MNTTDTACPQPHMHFHTFSLPSGRQTKSHKHLSLQSDVLNGMYPTNLSYFYPGEFSGSRGGEYDDDSLAGCCTA
jgi:hypothetical protein